MALNADERELVDSVMEAVEDYYPPLLALMFYRYDKESTGRAHIMPTEDIQRLAVHAFNDLNEHSNEQQEGS